ncbi:scabin-related ADP-ribosyltransferase [Amycolatopsis taiwanensis]|uniref:WXG100-like domain-containing protein n=1 Tax=Amycolatopsis taiwanensis TaxID=342230 RepID=UPI000483088B|nr:hypothetical protein [Amycolatopsis taiwanensis]
MSDPGDIPEPGDELFIRTKRIWGIDAVWPRDSEGDAKKLGDTWDLLGNALKKVVDDAMAQLNELRQAWQDLGGLAAHESIRNLLVGTDGNGGVQALADQCHKLAEFCRDYAKKISDIKGEIIADLAINVGLFALSFALAGPAGEAFFAARFGAMLAVKMAQFAKWVDELGALGRLAVQGGLSAAVGAATGGLGNLAGQEWSNLRGYGPIDWDHVGKAAVNGAIAGTIAHGVYQGAGKWIGQGTSRAVSNIPRISDTVAGQIGNTVGMAVTGAVTGAAMNHEDPVGGAIAGAGAGGLGALSVHGGATTASQITGKPPNTLSDLIKTHGGDNPPSGSNAHPTGGDPHAGSEPARPAGSGESAGAGSSAGSAESAGSAHAQTGGGSQHGGQQGGATAAQGGTQSEHPGSSAGNADSGAAGANPGHEAVTATGEQAGGAAPAMAQQAAPQASGNTGGTAHGGGSGNSTSAHTPMKPTGGEQPSTGDTSKASTQSQAPKPGAVESKPDSAAKTGEQPKATSEGTSRPATAEKAGTATPEPRTQEAVKGRALAAGGKPVEAKGGPGPEDVPPTPPAGDSPSGPRVAHTPHSADGGRTDQPGLGAGRPATADGSAGPPEARQLYSTLTPRQTAVFDQVWHETADSGYPAHVRREFAFLRATEDLPITRGAEGPAAIRPGHSTPVRVSDLHNGGLGADAWANRAKALPGTADLEAARTAEAAGPKSDSASETKENTPGSANHQGDSGRAGEPRAPRTGEAGQRGLSFVIREDGSVQPLVKEHGRDSAEAGQGHGEDGATDGPASAETDSPRGRPDDNPPSIDDFAKEKHPAEYAKRHGGPDESDGGTGPGGGTPPPPPGGSGGAAAQGAARSSSVAVAERPATAGHGAAAGSPKPDQPHPSSTTIVNEVRQAERGDAGELAEPMTIDERVARQQIVETGETGKPDSVSMPPEQRPEPPARTPAPPEAGSASPPADGSAAPHAGDTSDNPALVNRDFVPEVSPATPEAASAVPHTTPAPETQPAPQAVPKAPLETKQTTKTADQPVPELPRAEPARIERLPQAITGQAGEHAARTEPPRVGDPVRTPVGDPAPLRVGDPTPTRVGDPPPTRVSDPAPVRVGDPAPTRIGEPTRTGHPAPTRVGPPSAISAVTAIPQLPGDFPWPDGHPRRGRPFTPLPQTKPEVPRPLTTPEVEYPQPTHEGPVVTPLRHDYAADPPTQRPVREWTETVPMRQDYPGQEPPAPPVPAPDENPLFDLPDEVRRQLGDTELTDLWALVLITGVTATRILEWLTDKVIFDRARSVRDRTFITSHASLAEKLRFLTNELEEDRPAISDRLAELNGRQAPRARKSGGSLGPNGASGIQPRYGRRTEWQFANNLVIKLLNLADDIDTLRALENFFRSPVQFPLSDEMRRRVAALLPSLPKQVRDAYRRHLPSSEMVSLLHDLAMQKNDEYLSMAYPETGFLAALGRAGTEDRNKLGFPQATNFRDRTRLPQRKTVDGVAEFTFELPGGRTKTGVIIPIHRPDEAGRNEALRLAQQYLAKVKGEKPYVVFSREWQGPDEPDLTGLASQLTGAAAVLYSNRSPHRPATTPRISLLHMSDELREEVNVLTTAGRLEDVAGLLATASHLATPDRPSTQVINTLTHLLDSPDQEVAATAAVTLLALDDTALQNLWLPGRFDAPQRTGNLLEFPVSSAASNSPEYRIVVTQLNNRDPQELLDEIQHYQNSIPPTDTNRRLLILTNKGETENPERLTELSWQLLATGFDAVPVLHTNGQPTFDILAAKENLLTKLTTNAIGPLQPRSTQGLANWTLNKALAVYQEHQHDGASDSNGRPSGGGHAVWEHEVFAEGANWHRGDDGWYTSADGGSFEHKPAADGQPGRAELPPGTKGMFDGSGNLKHVVLPDGISHERGFDGQWSPPRREPGEVVVQKISHDESVIVRTDDGEKSVTFGTGNEKVFDKGTNSVTAYRMTKDAAGNRLPQPEIFVPNSEGIWSKHALVDTAGFEAYMAAANKAHDTARTLNDIAARSGERVPVENKLTNIDNKQLEELLKNSNPDDTRAATFELLRREKGVSLRWTQMDAALAFDHHKMVDMAAGEGKSWLFFFNAVTRAVEENIDAVYMMTTRDNLADRELPTYLDLLTEFGFDIHRMNSDDMPPPPSDGRPTIYLGTPQDLAFGVLKHGLLQGQTGPDAQLKIHVLMDEADEAFIHSNGLYLLSRGDMDQPAPQDVLDKVTFAGNTLRGYLKTGDLSEADFGRAPGQRGGGAALTDAGRNKLEGLLNHELTGEQVHRLNMAAYARWVYELGTHYEAHHGKIYIIDEVTGQVLADLQKSSVSRWNNGLAQAIEEHLGLTIRPDNDGSLSTTLHQVLSNPSIVSVVGASGTAKGHNFGAFGYLPDQVHDVHRYQEHRLVVHPDVINPDDASKLREIVQHIKETWADGTGRPQLIVAQNNVDIQKLSKMLNELGVEHNAVDAKWMLEHQERGNADEAYEQILKNAGKFGAVTLTNNVGGRGTDIKIAVAEDAAGGLHVIGDSHSKWLDADRQLMNRGGRDGGTGDVVFFGSPDDAVYAVDPDPSVQKVVVQYVNAAKAHDTHHTDATEHALHQAEQNMRDIVPHIQDAASEALRNRLEHMNQPNAPPADTTSKHTPDHPATDNNRPPDPPPSAGRLEEVAGLLATASHLATPDQPSTQVINTLTHLLDSPDQEVAATAAVALLALDDTALQNLWLPGRFDAPQRTGNLLEFPVHSAASNSPEYRIVVTQLNNRDPQELLDEIQHYHNSIPPTDTNRRLLILTNKGDSGTRERLTELSWQLLATGFDAIPVLHTDEQPTFEILAAKENLLTKLTANAIGPLETRSTQGLANWTLNKALAIGDLLGTVAPGELADLVRDVAARLSPGTIGRTISDITAGMTDATWQVLGERLAAEAAVHRMWGGNPLARREISALLARLHPAEAAAALWRIADLLGKSTTEPSAGPTTPPGEGGVTPAELRLLSPDPGKGILLEAADAKRILDELAARGIDVSQVEQDLRDSLHDVGRVLDGDVTVDRAALEGHERNVGRLLAAVDAALALADLHPGLLADLGLPGLKITGLRLSGAAGLEILGQQAEGAEARIALDTGQLSQTVVDSLLDNGFHTVLVHHGAQVFTVEGQTQAEPSGPSTGTPQQPRENPEPGRGWRAALARLFTFDIIPGRYLLRGVDLARQLTDVATATLPQQQALQDMLGTYARAVGRIGNRDLYVKALLARWTELTGRDQYDAEVIEVLAAAYGMSSQAVRAIAADPSVRGRLPDARMLEQQDFTELVRSAATHYRQLLGTAEGAIAMLEPADRQWRQARDEALSTMEKIAAEAVRNGLPEKIREKVLAWPEAKLRSVRTRPELPRRDEPAEPERPRNPGVLARFGIRGELLAAARAAEPAPAWRAAEREYQEALYELRRARGAAEELTGWAPHLLNVAEQQEVAEALNLPAEYVAAQRLLSAEAHEGPAVAGTTGVRQEVVERQNRLEQATEALRAAETAREQARREYREALTGVMRKASLAGLSNLAIAGLTGLDFDEVSAITGKPEILPESRRPLVDLNQTLVANLTALTDRALGRPAFPADIQSELAALDPNSPDYAQQLRELGVPERVARRLGKPKRFPFFHDIHMHPEGYDAGRYIDYRDLVKWLVTKGLPNIVVASPIPQRGRGLVAGSSGAFYYALTSAVRMSTVFGKKMLDMHGQFSDVRFFDARESMTEEEKSHWFPGISGSRLDIPGVGAYLMSKLILHGDVARYLAETTITKELVQPMLKRQASEVFNPVWVDFAGKLIAAAELVKADLAAGRLSRESFDTQARQDPALNRLFPADGSFSDLAGMEFYDVLTRNASRIHALLAAAGRYQEMRGLPETAPEMYNPNVVELLTAIAITGQVLILHNDMGLARLADNGLQKPGPPDERNLAPMAHLLQQERFAGARVVWAHLGVGHWTNLTVGHLEWLQWLLDTTNIRMDLSWNVLAQHVQNAENAAVKEEFIRFVIRNQDRLVFGTDSVNPQPGGHYLRHPNEMAPLLDEIEARPGGKQAVAKLMHGNFAALHAEAGEATARFAFNEISSGAWDGFLESFGSERQQRVRDWTNDRLAEGWVPDPDYQPYGPTFGLEEAKLTGDQPWLANPQLKSMKMWYDAADQRVAANHNPRRLYATAARLAAAELADDFRVFREELARLWHERGGVRPSANTDALARGGHTVDALLAGDRMRAALEAGEAARARLNMDPDRLATLPFSEAERAGKLGELIDLVEQTEREQVETRENIAKFRTEWLNRNASAWAKLGAGAAVAIGAGAVFGVPAALAAGAFGIAGSSAFALRGVLNSAKVAYSQYNRARTEGLVERGRLDYQSAVSISRLINEYLAADVNPLGRFEKILAEVESKTAEETVQFLTGLQAIIYAPLAEGETQFQRAQDISEEVSRYLNMVGRSFGADPGAISMLHPHSGLLGRLVAGGIALSWLVNLAAHSDQAMHLPGFGAWVGGAYAVADGLFLIAALPNFVSGLSGLDNTLRPLYRWIQNAVAFPVLTVANGMLVVQDLVEGRWLEAGVMAALTGATAYISKLGFDIELKLGRQGARKGPLAAFTAASALGGLGVMGLSSMPLLDAAGAAIGFSGALLWAGNGVWQRVRNSRALDPAKEIMHALADRLPGAHLAVDLSAPKLIEAPNPDDPTDPDNPDDPGDPGGSPTAPVPPKPPRPAGPSSRPDPGPAPSHPGPPKTGFPASHQGPAAPRSIDDLINPKPSTPDGQKPADATVSTGQQVRYAPAGMAIGNDPDTGDAHLRITNGNAPDPRQPYLVTLHSSISGHPVPGLAPSPEQAGEEQYRISPEEVAEAIRNSPHYTEGRPVQLESCGAIFWAQRLADALGAEVLAPAGIADVPPDGKVTVAGFPAGGGRWRFTAGRTRPSMVPAPGASGGLFAAEPAGGDVISMGGGRWRQYRDISALTRGMIPPSVEPTWHRHARGIVTAASGIVSGNVPEPPPGLARWVTLVETAYGMLYNARQLRAEGTYDPELLRWAQEHPEAMKYFRMPELSPLARTSEVNALPAIHAGVVTAAEQRWYIANQHPLLPKVNPNFHRPDAYAAGWQTNGPQAVVGYFHGTLGNEMRVEPVPPEEAWRVDGKAYVAEQLHGTWEAHDSYDSVIDDIYGEWWAPKSPSPLPPMAALHLTYLSPKTGEVVEKWGQVWWTEGGVVFLSPVPGTLMLLPENPLSISLLPITYREAGRINLPERATGPVAPPVVPDVPARPADPGQVAWALGELDAGRLAGLALPGLVIDGVDTDRPTVLHGTLADGTAVLIDVVKAGSTGVPAFDIFLGRIIRDRATAPPGTKLVYLFAEAPGTQLAEALVGIGADLVLARAGATDFAVVAARDSGPAPDLFSRRTTRSNQDIVESGDGLPRTRETVARTAEAAGIDLTGVGVHLVETRSEIEYLDEVAACAVTPPELAGRQIRLGPASFADVETLVAVLAHELTHVRQLRSGIIPTEQTRERLEAEAEANEIPALERFRNHDDNDVRGREDVRPAGPRRDPGDRPAAQRHAGRWVNPPAPGDGSTDPGPRPGVHQSEPAGNRPPDHPDRPEGREAGDPGLDADRGAPGAVLNLPPTVLRPPMRQAPRPPGPAENRGRSSTPWEGNSRFPRATPWQNNTPKPDVPAGPDWNDPLGHVREGTRVDRAYVEEALMLGYGRRALVWRTDRDPLFRHDDRPPEVIFNAKQGFTGQGTRIGLAQHLSDVRGGLVATTRDLQHAITRAMRELGEGKSEGTPKVVSYVYEIYAPGGVDVTRMGLGDPIEAEVAFVHSVDVRYIRNCLVIDENGVVTAHIWNPHFSGDEG